MMVTDIATMLSGTSGITPITGAGDITTHAVTTTHTLTITTTIPTIIITATLTTTISGIRKEFL